MGDNKMKEYLTKKYEISHADFKIALDIANGEKITFISVRNDRIIIETE